MRERFENFAEGGSGCFKSTMFFFILLVLIAAIIWLDQLPGLVFVLTFCIGVLMYIAGYFTGLGERDD